MVEVKVEKKGKNSVEVEFVDEDVAIAEAIKSFLLGEENVDFAAVVKEHPEVGHPRLILRMKKGEPLSAAKKAVAKVGKAIEELQKKVK